MACVKWFGSEDNFRRLNRARGLAKEKGLTIPQVGIAYLMSQGLNIFPLVGCKAPEHFEANMEAMAVRLTAEEVDWLELTHGDM